MSEENLQLETIASAPQPRLYTDEEVNSLVGRKKAEAAARATREVEERYAREREQSMQVKPVALDERDLIEKAKQAAKAELIQELNSHKQKVEDDGRRAELDRSAKQYWSHVKDIQVDPEEDECGLFTKSGVEKYAPLQIMAGEFNFDNTAEIMRELAKNPRNLRIINDAAKDDDKAAVKAMLKKISSSIKQNQEALDSKPNIKAPLAQLKPSTVGSSSSKMGLSDFKKAKWLRG